MKKDEDRIDTILLAIGSTIDNTCKKYGNINTFEISIALARLAASAGALCNKSDRSAGMCFVIQEFFEAVKEQCDKHDIRGIDLIMDMNVDNSKVN